MRLDISRPGCFDAQAQQSYGQNVGGDEEREGERERGDRGEDGRSEERTRESRSATGLHQSA